MCVLWSARFAAESAHKILEEQSMAENTMIKDCQGIPYPVFAEAVVKSCSPVKGAKPDGSVFLLGVRLPENSAEPLPGQFYMLHAVKSDVLLGRPISVFRSCRNGSSIEVEFLILVKGRGTQELCALEPGDGINLLGPLGNIFPAPEKSAGKVCIAGGGIGVAPVAGFAATLKEKSYDFYASFKSGSYGIQYVRPEKLVVTTDDGSEGIKGMLPSALTAQVLSEEKYSAVYACGPTPMLAYIQKICREAGIRCWLSMEAHMACGVGVCLGCTVQTVEGKKRCCKDGPVFDGASVVFPEPAPIPRRAAFDGEPDLSVTVKGVRFENPVVGSSGTFGFGTEYKSVFDVNRLGGIASKGLTLEPREGNDGIRLWETPSGLMNSIGLQNPGIPHFIEHELPEMLKLKPVAIANLSGSTLESYVEGARLLDKTEIPMIELNISCPNVAAGGAAFGMSCASASAATSAVRAVTSKPLVVKLTPQSPELTQVALSCIEAGADGISLCNSFQGVAIDIERGIPVFDKVKAGFGGPAVRPVALRLVWELAEAISQLPEEKRVPIFAIGGLATWQDAVEFIMAGASVLEVGTVTFANPFSMIQMIDGLRAFMKRKGYRNLDEMRGIAHNKGK